MAICRSADWMVPDDDGPRCIRMFQWYIMICQNHNICFEGVARRLRVTAFLVRLGGQNEFINYIESEINSDEVGINYYDN